MVYYGEYFISLEKSLYLIVRYGIMWMLFILRLLIVLFIYFIFLMI